MNRVVVNQLRQRLQRGEFVVMVEITPGRGSRLAEHARVAAALTAVPQIAAASITSNAGGHSGEDPIPVARAVADVGLTPNVHLTCVWMDRRGLGRDLDRLHALGLENVFAMTGDWPAEKTRVRPRYDIDSVQLTATLAEGGQGMRVLMPDWEAMVPHPPAAPHPPLPPSAPRAPMAWSFRGDDGRDFAFKMLSGGPRKLGIEYMELGEQLASYFKLAGKSGVLVTSVDADGPAAKAGLKAGDAIVKLGSDSIADGDDLRDALSEAEGGSEVAITVQRDGHPVELKVTLAKPEQRRKHREARGVSL